MRVDPTPARPPSAGIDPARAALGGELIHALDRRLAGALVLTAELADGAAPSGWIAFDSGEAAVHIAPLLADGAVCSLTDPLGRPDASSAAVALGAVEPLNAAIELAIGRPLRPVGVTDGAATVGDLVLRLEAWSDGRPVHRLLLALPGDLPIAPAGVLPPDPASVVEVAPAWTARIAGPTLPTARLAAISVGDLLLLGCPTGLARFRLPGRDVALAGRLNIARGVIEVEQELALAEPPPSDRLVGGDEPASATITVEFDAGGLSLDRLAAIGIGGVVPLAGLAGGVLPVRLLAADRPVASGDLVVVGDGHGVLVTALPASIAREG